MAAVRLDLAAHRVIVDSVDPPGCGWTCWSFLTAIYSGGMADPAQEKIILTLVTSLTILYFGQAFIGALLSIRGNVDGIGVLHSIRLR